MSDLTQEQQDEIKAKAQVFQDAYMAMCKEHGFIHQAVLQSSPVALFAALTIVKTPEPETKSE